MPLLVSARASLRRVLLGGLYLACAGIVLTLFVRGNGINYMPPARFGDMVSGEASRPFVYRALLPGTVRAVTAVTQHTVQLLGLDHEGGSWDTPGNFLFNLTKPTAVSPELSFEYAVAFLLMLLCLVGFAVALRGLSRHFFAYPDFVHDFAPAFALVLIPLIFFRYINYIYDPVTLGTFAASLYLIFRRHYALYYLALAAAALNKETALLLVLVFALSQYTEISRARLCFHIGAQSALMAAIKLVLTHLYRENPGSLVEFHLLDHNLRALTDPVMLILTLGAVIPIAFLVGRGWPEKPNLLRRGLLGMGIPLFAAALLWGYIDELRVYYELYPFIALLAIPTIADLWQIPEVEKPPADSPAAGGKSLRRLPPPAIQHRAASPTPRDRRARGAGACAQGCDSRSTL